MVHISSPKKTGFNSGIVLTLHFDFLSLFLMLINSFDHEYFLFCLCVLLVFRFHARQWACWKCGEWNFD